jgi:hypothetical protein
MQAPIYDDAIFASVFGDESESLDAGVAVSTPIFARRSPGADPANAWRRVVHALKRNKRKSSS